MVTVCFGLAVDAGVESVTDLFALAVEQTGAVEWFRHIGWLMS